MNTTKTYLWDFKEFLPPTVFSPDEEIAHIFLNRYLNVCLKPLQEFSGIGFHRYQLGDKLPSSQALCQFMIQKFQPEFLETGENKCVILNDEPLYVVQMKQNCYTGANYTDILKLVRKVIPFDKIPIIDRLWIDQVHQQWLQKHGPTPYLRIDYITTLETSERLLIEIEAVNAILFSKAATPALERKVQQILKAFV